MMQFEIMIHCPELVILADAIQSRKVLPAVAAAAPEPAPAPEPPVEALPTKNPKPAPIVEDLPVAQTYDKDTLVRAAAELMDQGKQQELLALLSRFNVPSMVALDPSQFAEFGAAMKEMGAKL